MLKPRVIVLAGYGLNCEEETKFAFETAGGRAEIVHINDLAANKKLLGKFQILAIPGGFSYGDDTGSGKAYANQLRNHLEEELTRWVRGDRLAIGICNGFQILTNLGFLPGALLPNRKARYLDRWVDLNVQGESPWLRGIKSFSAPIAHGEGRYYIDERGMLEIKKDKRVALQYMRGEICDYQQLEPNPNGAMEDIAGIVSSDGKILGMMPHPERAMFFTQLPHWPYLKEKLLRAGKKIPVYGPGLEIFRNAVGYFK